MPTKTDTRARAPVDTVAVPAATAGPDPASGPERAPLRPRLVCTV